MEFLIYCNNNTYVLKVTEQKIIKRRQIAKGCDVSYIFYCLLLWRRIVIAL
jgi:hypothetical protein